MDTAEELHASVMDAPDATGAPAPPLTMPADASPGAVEVTRELLPSLRAFHRGDATAAADLGTPEADHVPALLHRYRDSARIRHDYPLYLAPAGADGVRRCVPLAETLRDAVTSFADGAEDARILRDNLARLERAVRARLDGSGAATEAPPVLVEAGHDLVRELNLKPASTTTLENDLQRLHDALPADGALVGLGDLTTITLLALAAEEHLGRHRRALQEEVSRLHRALGELLRVERGKDESSRRADALRRSVGDAGSELVDPERLAQMLGDPRGVQPIDPSRRRRLEQVGGILERFRDEDEPPLLSVVGTGPRPEALSERVEWHAAAEGDTIAEAMRLFDERATAHAELFGALRLARLLTGGAYEPQRHDALFDAFDREAFSDEELRRLPPVAALIPPGPLAGETMIELSDLLRSGRPVSVLAAVTPATDPGAGTDGDGIGGYRFELAYLGISHREALVHQSSAARPEHLLAGFLAALDATHASLHVLTSGLTADGTAPPLGAWAHAGAALEGRAHPFLHYNPEAGATWARRLDVAGNPQVDSDWPQYELTYRDAEGGAATMPLAFTFADFALLEHSWCGHFRIIPPACTHEDIVSLEAFLALDAEESDHRLPYIWSADEGGHLHRLLVSRRLALACRDRLGFWRTLQELAGIRNEHVREAVQRQREELEASFAAERAALEAQHAEAMQGVRAEAAREAMQRLAHALLSADPAAALTAAAPAPAVAPAPVEGGGEAGAQVETEAETGVETETRAEAGPEAAEDEPEEPWIDSALCTSCNDCLEINPQLFVYNANKQATIGDPSAGTYAQLVKAAEKCPARCIHPGTPLDGSEPNLDELRERAKPFR